MLDSSPVIQRQILLTLAYSAVFAFPLTRSEVLARLIVPQVHTGVDWSAFLRLNQRQKLTVIQKALQRLELLGWVSRQGELVTLAGLEKNFALRRERSQFAQINIQSAEPLVRWLRRLPWVVGVGLSGSAAVGNAREQDDTDFVIVAQPRRLWLVRLLALGLASLWRKRAAKHGVSVTGTGRVWCINLLVEADTWVPEVRRSLYAAFELHQIHWVFIRDSSWPFFHQTWVQQYLLSETSASPPTEPNQTADVLQPLLDRAEALAFRLQHWYMRASITRELISPAAAYFHPRRMDVPVLLRMRHQLEKAGLTP